MDEKAVLANIPEDRSAIGLITEAAWKGARPDELISNLQSTSKITSPSGSGMQPFLIKGALLEIKGKINASTGYEATVGKPCNKVYKLSSLIGQGFTLCGAVHMTGFDKATSAEIAEIESLLLSGVIL